MNSINDFIALTKDIVRADTNILDTTKFTELVLNALDIFSREYPRTIIADITGNETGEYDIATVMSAWVNDFSQIRSLEYPTGKNPPTYLNEGIDHHYYIYRSATGTYKLRFVSYSPNSSETIRIEYTVPWVGEGTGANISSIPAQQQRAFCYLAASLAHKVLAAYFAVASEQAIGADVIDFSNKSGQHQGLARGARATYNEIMGQASGVKPASVTRDWDVKYPWGGERLVHISAYR